MPFTATSYHNFNVGSHYHNLVSDGGRETIPMAKKRTQIPQRRIPFVVPTDRSGNNNALAEKFTPVIGHTNGASVRNLHGGSIESMAQCVVSIMHYCDRHDVAFSELLTIAHKFYMEDTKDKGQQSLRYRTIEQDGDEGVKKFV
jgi:hypothetical protein